MADTPLTLMAVHAHPDDEASTTGGILAKYGGEGVRTVLVTCTNGECGDGPGGAKPGDPGHDEAAVVALRRGELEESCRILGVQHLELLGYRDSGMEGWPTNHAPGAFWTLDVETAATPLVALMDRYDPQVVVTYDDYGFYGHPDHIQAHRITVAALRRTRARPELYYPTVRRSRFAETRERIRESGVELPDVDETKFGSPDEDIAAIIDCRDQASAKLAALRAHASQAENVFFVRFSVADFTEMFGIEEFVRPAGPVSPSPRDDLFAGVRDPLAD
jgi:LmbE family N-acetylglucosaminyl deacetylase